MWVWKQHHTTDAVNCHRKRPDSSRSRRFLFTSRNKTDWKVFVLLQSSQVMETRHDGAEEDRVKRLPEILFCVILGELYLCVTLPAVLSPFLGPSTRRRDVRFVSICRARVKLQGRQMEMSWLLWQRWQRWSQSIWPLSYLSWLRPAGGERESSPHSHCSHLN